MCMCVCVSDLQMHCNQGVLSLQDFVILTGIKMTKFCSFFFFFLINFSEKVANFGEANG